MPVAACPQLLESDYLLLHYHFTVAGGWLHDEPLGARHRLAPAAEQLLLLLQWPVRYRDLRQAAALQHMHTRQLADILAFLHTEGALIVHRQLGAWWPAGWLRVQELARGRLPIARLFRAPASLGGIAVATLRACMPLLVAVTASTVVAGALLAVPLASLVGWSAGGLVYFELSVLLHEVAHAWMLRALGVPAVVCQQRLWLYVLHRRLPRRQEVLVAAAGPLAGGLLGAVCALAAATQRVGAAMVFGCLLGLFHLSSLLPWSSDGQSLYGRRVLHA